jgi:SAM-dependent methyltransferase
VSLPRAYFDGLYERSKDPWGLASRAYEARKYALTLAALPRSRYRRAFEPGCSIGVLTGMLAERADVLLASDISLAALETARRRGLPDHVELVAGAVPAAWPKGRFDLIVFSELGYYLCDEDLGSFIERASGSLEADGHLVAVHWRAPVPDYPGDAARVHDRLRASRLEPLAHYEDRFFVLDVLGATGAARLSGPEDCSQPRERSPT